MKITRNILAAGLVLAFAGEAAASNVCGDVNDSGSVTSSDALSVLKEAVGQNVTLECAPLAQTVRTGDEADYGPRSDGAQRRGIARSFTDNGDGTITDNATGLVWEKKDNAGGIHDKDNTYTWTASLGGEEMNGTVVTSFLAGLNSGSGFAGRKDWRLPNRHELETLLHMGDEAPSIQEEFQTACPTDCDVTECSCVRSSNYWTSTTFFSDTTGAWTVRFNDSGTSAILKSEALYARAVRGGS